MKKLGFICVLFAVIIGVGWAIHLYFHAPKTNDPGVSGLIIEGNNFLNIGRYDKAKQLFLAALKDEPKNINADFGLKKVEAKELPSLSNFKLAVDSLYQMEPSDSHVNLFLGEYYLANGELDKARSYFEQALTQNPKLAEAHFDLAMLYDLQGDINSAKSEASLAIDIAPMPKYRNRLGHLYIKQKHLDSATAEYEKTSEYPLSALDVAEIYWQRDRLDLALIRQLQAIQWLNDSNVMAKSENQDPWFFKISAEETIKLARLEEKQAYAYLNLSFTLHLLGNYEESERYIQEMRNLDVARQNAINSIMKSNLDALLQEKYSLTPQSEAFKNRYLQ